VNDELRHRVIAEILACPVCHQALSQLRCSACGREYPRRQGVIDFTPRPLPDPEAQERWQLWSEVESNGAQAYELDPPSSLSVGERADAKAFAKFCQLEGLVLDVGCGPQELPTYAADLPDSFVGIDPLRGRQPRAFTFVQGIAEYLPFQDGVFDRILFATSIDHLLQPGLAITEARRVLKPRGAVCIWLGELPRKPLRERWKRRQAPETVMRIETPRASMEFDVPPGAADAFHVTHPSPRQVRRWLTQAGLHVRELQRPSVGHCFIRAIDPSAAS
jgi:SAM-dependent methyltransferase